MRRPDLDHFLSEVRDLIRDCKVGGPGTFEPFRRLVDILLRLTIMDESGFVRLIRGEDPTRAVLGGPAGPTDPLLLNDGRYFRLSVSLYLDSEDRNFLKTRQSSYQYQHDRNGDQWVFRYDYLRRPEKETLPPAHFQMRAESPEGWEFHKVHFPTGRVSLEAVLRLLAEDFAVPCNRPDISNDVLAESERAFLEMAHHPVSWPES